ncbi:NDR1/HIN1-like protein 6 [Pistacia vera]|uniref:NDR1/HIN1-like protein 6 n=1 Tax=Pistacia vera TaxID=55513 RepID=UPI001262E065|nr:NDR1/HIN1-like protein 6 [Pistacia vera]
MDYGYNKDNVQASNDPPPYHPKYVMLNNEQTTGNLRPPPQRRNPPRYNSQHPSLQSSSSGNGCLKCICCCYCCLFSLIVILTIVAYILYASFKPEVPIYNIENFQVNSFKILLDFSLNTEVTAFVKADNPNSHIGFKYGKDSSVIVNYKGTTLCSGKLPAFSQPNDNITTFSVGLRGQTEVGSALQESLMADKKAGKIPLLVTIKAPVVVVLGSFPLREVVASIHCSLVVDSLAPDKPINILSSKYDYDVSF